MTRWTLGVVTTIAFCTGCASRPAPPPRAGSAASPFEQMKDPPISAATHFAAGQLAETQNRLDDAVAQYRQAIVLDPKHANATFRLGVVYAELKDFPRAIETWESYVKLTHGSAWAYSNLAFCQELAGNPAAAESAYRKGIAADPKNEPCRVNYGLMLARTGHPAEALAQLQTVLTPAQSHYDLASIYESQGRKPEARAEYHKAADLDPTLQDAKSRLADLN